jgi:hypothetical protein
VALLALDCSVLQRFSITLDIPLLMSSFFNGRVVKGLGEI